MTSLINKFFHQPRTNEQNIINGFVKESIQIRGQTYIYLPRNVQIMDLILGEDILSKFQLAVPIEMYLADVQGFQGDKEMFSKFGLEIRNSYKLVVSKDRWEIEIKSKFDNVAGNGEATFDISNYIRPMEGDLIYDPITKFLLEVKFVDHDVEFFALGKNYQYYLSCEAFQYQSEIIETGVSDIDVFNLNSLDTLHTQILLENGNEVIYEQGGHVIPEHAIDPTPIRPINATEFPPEVVEIKLSVTNPFE